MLMKLFDGIMPEQYKLFPPKGVTNRGGDDIDVHDVVKTYFPNARFDERASEEAREAWFMYDGQQEIADGYEGVDHFMHKYGTVQDINIGDLIFYQTTVSSKGTVTTDYPFVVKSGHGLYLYEGYHRVIDAILNGEKAIRALVLDCTKEDRDRRRLMDPIDPDYIGLTRY